MRRAFVNTLVDLATQDTRIILLTGDLGFMALEPFAEKFPGRFINAGVAEQNMVGLATGLAEAGFVPFVYSIMPFAVLRPYEFIRNGPIHHQSQVRIVGIGAGLEYSHQGNTHYGLEDVGIMRIQPGLTFLCVSIRLRKPKAPLEQRGICLGRFSIDWARTTKRWCRASMGGLNWDTCKLSVTVATYCSLLWAQLPVKSRRLPVGCVNGAWNVRSQSLPA